MKKRGSFQPRVLIIALLLIAELLIISGFVALIIYVPFSNQYVWVPSLIIFLFDLILAVFIANSKVEASFKISWLVVVVSMPLMGGIFYFLFANKITTKKMREQRINVVDEFMLNTRPDSKKEISALKKENVDAGSIAEYIYLNAYNGVYQNTNVEYYKIGDLSKEPMINELKKAKKFIFIEYFIMQSGDFFDAIFDVLKQKAEEGVDVRMIYDDFGCSSKMSSFFYVEVRKAGIQCHPFNYIRPFLDFRQNNRDHRKIIVIDGVVGFTGGINLADEYINKGSKFGLWKDNCVMLKGEGVNGLTNIFLSNWGLVSKDRKETNTLETANNYSYLFNKELDLRQNKISSGFVVPFGEEPFDGEETARNVFLQMICRANKYIYISTPYLILDEELISALSIAAKSGIDVRIITPGTPDKKIIYQCTRSYYSVLFLNGVRIYEYTPGFNHEKIMVVDGIMAETGTVNFDFRSLYLHYENGIFFYGGQEIKDMDEDLKHMLSESHEVDYRSYLHAPLHRRIWWSILRILAPLF